jgi:outer membrane protein OmpA-like peptidoglycan-associated protein
LRSTTLRLIAAVAATVSLSAGCSSGSDEEASSSTTEVTEVTGTAPEESTTTSSGPEESTTSSAVGPVGGEDLNDDGHPDPVCGTRDFKAGLVLKVLCDAAGYANEPSQGTTLVPNSLYGMPGVADDVKADVLSESSGNGIRGRDPEGRQVMVFFIQSDTLFDVGSATVSSPAKETLNGLARGLQRRFPTVPIQVRGHTDATGSAAANQTLSEQRAANVASYLATQGIDRARLTSIGLAATLPVVLEKNPDGSDNPLGRRENRRVELVLRLP